METYGLSLRKVGGYSVLIVSVIALFVVLSPSTHAKEYSSLKNDCLVLVNKQNPRDLAGASWVPCYPGMPEHAPVTGKKIVGVSKQSAEKYIRSYSENDLTPIPDPRVEQKYYVKDLDKSAPRVPARSESRYSHSAYVPQHSKGVGAVFHPIPSTSAVPQRVGKDSVPYIYRVTTTTTTSYHKPASQQRSSVQESSRRSSHRASESVKKPPYMMYRESTSTYYASQYKKSETSTRSENGRVVYTSSSYERNVTKTTSETKTTVRVAPKKKPVVQKPSVKSPKKCLLVTHYSDT